MVNRLAAPFGRRTNTGPRRAASAGRGALICRAPVGAHLSRGPPRLQNTRLAQRRQIERRRLSDLMRRAAPAWQTGRSNQVFHHRQQVRQRAVVLARQHAAVRQRPLPAFRDDRQCPGAAAAAGGVRHRAGRAGLRFLDGGAAGVPLGDCSPTGSSGIAPICDSAKTSAHNFVFLEGVKAALTADPVWQDG